MSSFVLSGLTLFCFLQPWQTNNMLFFFRKHCFLTKICTLQEALKSVGVMPGIVPATM